MLFDPTTMQKAQSTEKTRSWYPADYSYSKEIYVYRMTWEGETEGDLMTFHEAVDFIVSLIVEGETITLAEAYGILTGPGHTIHIGPDDDRYTFTPLDEPMVKDRSGEIVTIEERDEGLKEVDYGVRPGIDFPASLSR